MIKTGLLFCGKAETIGFKMNENYYTEVFFLGGGRVASTVELGLFIFFFCLLLGANFLDL